MSFWTSYALALATVAMMLAGLYTIARIVKGRGFAGANRRLVTVLESTMLSQRSAVHVIKVGTRYLLVGGSDASISALAEFSAQEVEGWLAPNSRST